MPTLAVLASVVMMFGTNIDGIKKEIYGYGVSDLPADEKCAVVFDNIKKFTCLETVIFLSIATFGLPSLSLEVEDYTPWLFAFPIIGMLRAMNTYFTPEAEQKAPEVATDLNGLPPQPKEDEGVKNADDQDSGKDVQEKKVENEESESKPEDKVIEGVELIKEGVKEKVEKIEGEIKDKIQEKIDSEPEKVAFLKKMCTKVKDAIACVTSLILAVIAKCKSCIDCICGHIVALPWNCITEIVVGLGTAAVFTYCLWYLTLDCAVFAFPVIHLVLPKLVLKAKERQWLTDNSGHLISETATLAAGSTLYYLFRTYIQHSI